MNVFLPSISVQFRPFFKQTFEPQRTIEKIVEENKQNTTLKVAGFCEDINRLSRVASYAFSPAFHLPVDLGILFFGGVRVISLISTPSTGFDSIVGGIELGVALSVMLLAGHSLAYVRDGTLGKLSADCGNLADECAKVVSQIEKQKQASPSRAPPPIICPPQIQEKPEDPSFIQSIIYYVNAVIRAIYQVFSYCFQKLSGCCSD